MFSKLVTLFFFFVLSLLSIEFSHFGISKSLNNESLNNEKMISKKNDINNSKFYGATETKSSKEKAAESSKEKGSESSKKKVPKFYSKDYTIIQKFKNKEEPRKRNSKFEESKNQNIFKNLNEKIKKNNQSIMKKIKENKFFLNKYFFYTTETKAKLEKYLSNLKIKFVNYLFELKEFFIDLFIHRENLQKKILVHSIYSADKNILIKKKFGLKKFNEIIWVNKDNKKIFYDGERTDINEIVKSGVLKIGLCSTNQHPFHEIKDDGRIVGFDIFLAEEICSVLEVRPQFIIIGEKWDEVVDALVNNNIDVMISNLSLTPERAIKILCSEPYAKIKQSLLINRRLITEAGNKNYFSVKDIISKFGKSFVVESDTAYAQQVHHIFPKAKIAQEDSWEKIIQKICDREYIGTISDEIEIMRVFKKNPEYLFELMQVNIKNKYDYMVVGVKKSAKQLLHFINGYIIANGVECKIN